MYHILNVIIFSFQGNNAAVVFIWITATLNFEMEIVIMQKRSKLIAAWEPSVHISICAAAHHVYQVHHVSPEIGFVMQHKNLNLKANAFTFTMQTQIGLNSVDLIAFAFHIEFNASLVVTRHSHSTWIKQDLNKTDAFIISNICFCFGFNGSYLLLMLNLELE